MNNHLQKIKANFTAKFNHDTEAGSFIDRSQILKKVLKEIGFIEQSGNWIAPEDAEEWNAYIESKMIDFSPQNGYQRRIEKPRPLVRQYRLDEILQLL